MRTTHLPPATLQKGRGATANRLSQRFDRIERETDGDFLDRERMRNACDPCDPDSADGPISQGRRTYVVEEHPRTAITRNQSPDIPFDRSINAYRGCEHGCVYCFARPTHAYLGLSPGQDFESRLTAKRGIPDLLRRELAKPGYECRPIALGTNTDPYQPIEARYRTTRGILEVLSATSHPVTITTKGARVVDDLDIIAGMAARSLAAVMLSVTTLDPKTARTMEPRASAPAKRLAAIRRLADAGIPVHVSVSPVIPAINDHEIEAILDAAAAAGAAGAYSIVVRLPHEVSPIFRAWLDAHYPDRAARVMSHLTEMRGGRDNDPNFFDRFRPKGPYAAMLQSRFRKAQDRLGLTHRLDLRTDLFELPGAQLSLL
ncbi:MAG: PA0069 family radical SAM protein [Pseudomonadota bacterium]